jgi:hypothetical protein
VLGGWQRQRESGVAPPGGKEQQLSYWVLKLLLHGLRHSMQVADAVPWPATSLRLILCCSGVLRQPMAAGEVAPYVSRVVLTAADAHSSCAPCVALL